MWDAARSTLHAAGACSYIDWLGAYHHYREFDTEWLRGTDILGPRKGGEPMERSAFWPDRALHVENAFGYAYDAGSHVMREFASCRGRCAELMSLAVSYRFKEQPELDVLPDYGDGEPMGEDFFF